MLKIRSKKKCTMVKQPIFSAILGIAGNFFTGDGDIIPAIIFGLHPQLSQGCDHRAGKTGEVKSSGTGTFIDDEGEIQIAPVMINCSSP